MSANAIWTDIVFFIQTLNFLPPMGQYTLWDNRTFDFSQYKDIDGSLIVNNALMSVVMDPYDIFTITSVVENDDGNFKACVTNISFSEFNFTMDYTADIGISNNIPLYGNGLYNANLTDIATSFCWLLASTQNEILDFDINIEFRHNSTVLTGIFLNEELDPIISHFLSQAKRFLAMWNNYETECSRKCILNPIFLFMTNYLIHDVNKKADINFEECGCLARNLDMFAKELFSGIQMDFDFLNKNMFSNFMKIIGNALL